MTVTPTAARAAAARHSAGWWAGLLAVWAVSRAVVLGYAVSRHTRATLFNDITLVWSWAHQEPFGDDPAPVLTEYPGLARLLARSALLSGDPVSFGWAWVAVMLSLDLVLLLVLARAGGRPAWLWVIGGAALGPVVWLRYDLLVAVLVVLAVRWRGPRPAWSGVLLGLAVLLKLWPLVLAAALLPRPQVRRWVLAAGGTVLAGVAAEALLAGRDSIVTPLVYQSGRGLQIESLLATPTLWASRGQDPTTVWEFEFRAFQLQDSAGPAWDLLGLVVTALACLVVLGLGHRAGSAAAADGPATPRQDALRAASAALLATVLVAVNTVFSPQYVLWFLPLVALATAAARVPWAVDVVLVALAGLTQLIWPWYYESLLNLFPEALTVLTLRNLLVAVLVVLLAVVVARQARGPTGPDALAASAQPATNDSRT